jgi:DNA-binding transcriptional LysR family regulator
MDLVSLQIFKAVAESGGISRAAARLHRVQSNVTTRVKQLEERLGTRLFHRRNRRLVLSDEGRTLLGYADRLLRLSSEAEAAMRATSAPRGTLRLGSLESTAATRLPPLLASYHRAFPEVRLELATGTSGSLVERVLQGELEAAFVAEPFTADGLERQHAYTEELVLVAPRAASLARLPILAFAAGCSYRRRLEAWLGRSGIAPGTVMEYGSYHAIVACVSAGAGIAIVPRSILSAARGRRHFEVRALPADIGVARTFLVWRAGHRAGALDALKDLLSPLRRAEPARPSEGSPAYRDASRRRGAARPSPRSSRPASSR